MLMEMLSSLASTNTIQTSSSQAAIGGGRDNAILNDSIMPRSRGLLEHDSDRRHKRDHWRATTTRFRQRSASTIGGARATRF